MSALCQKQTFSRAAETMPIRISERVGCWPQNKEAASDGILRCINWSDGQPVASKQCIAQLPAESRNRLGFPATSSSVGEPMEAQNSGQCSEKGNSSVDDVALVIPVLNEAAVMPRLFRLLGILHPAPAEIIAVDGGSQDNTAALVRQSGSERLIEHAVRGRAAAINRGVIAARSPLVCVLHADTILPDDAIAVIRATMQDPQLALAGFISLIAGAERVRWGTTFHNWIKTWYAPLIFRPHLFFRGARLLFGDQAMFFRRSDFLAVEGCDEKLTVMEDADLCLRLHRRGRIRLVNRTVTTSDRRIAVWGELKANLIYLYVGIRWGLGLRHRIERHYPDIR
jgi:GT2 family glycosyltransferase